MNGYPKEYLQVIHNAMEGDLQHLDTLTYYEGRLDRIEKTKKELADIGYTFTKQDWDGDVARETIYLDRYSKKDTNRETYQVGDILLTQSRVVEPSGRATKVRLVDIFEDGNIIVERLDAEDDQVFALGIDETDKPTERIEDSWMRVAKALASTAPTPEKRKELFHEVAWALDDFRLTTGGRIMYAADLDNPDAATLINCFVIDHVALSLDAEQQVRNIIERGKEEFEIEARGGGVGIPIAWIPEVDTIITMYDYGYDVRIASPHDSRGGIMDTLEKFAVLALHGNKVTVNVSSLRPRNSYCKTVNGRASGAYSFVIMYAEYISFIEAERKLYGIDRYQAHTIEIDASYLDIYEFLDSEELDKYREFFKFVVVNSVNVTSSDLYDKIKAFNAKNVESNWHRPVSFYPLIGINALTAAALYSRITNVTIQGGSR